MSLHVEVEDIRDGFINEIENQKKYYEGANNYLKVTNLNKLSVYINSIANMRGYSLDDDAKEKIEEAYSYLTDAEKSILKSELSKDLSKKNVAFIIKLMSKNKKASKIIKEDMLDKNISYSKNGHKVKMQVPPLVALDFMVDKKSEELAGFDITYNPKKRKPVANSGIVSAVDALVQKGNLPQSKKINKVANKIEHIKKEDLEKNKAELELLKLTDLSNGLDPKKYRYTKSYVDRLIKKREKTLVFKTMYLNSFDISELNNMIMGNKYHEAGNTMEETEMKR